MMKHEKLQSLVLIRVQKNENKNTIETFYQRPSVHTLYIYNC